MIKAVAWDIDGTLVDSEPLHLFALNEVCRAFGVDLSDLDDAHFIGVHIGNVWRELRPRFSSSLSFEDWSARVNIAFSENHEHLSEIPGAKAVVQRLAAMNLRQIAVSNSNRIVVDTNLSSIGVDKYMESSISLDDVCEGKPDPFPYRLACSKFGLNPSDVLAVEDSATGVASAIAAGMPVAYLHAPNPCRKSSVTPISHLSEVLELVRKPAARTTERAP